MRRPHAQMVGCSGAGTARIIRVQRRLPGRSGRARARGQHACSAQGAPRGPRRGKSSLMGASKFLATWTMTGVPNTQKMSAGKQQNKKQNMNAGVQRRAGEGEQEVAPCAAKMAAGPGRAPRKRQRTAPQRGLTRQSPAAAAAPHRHLAHTRRCCCTRCTAQPATPTHRRRRGRRAG